MNETAIAALMLLGGVLMVINGALPMLWSKYYERMRSIWESPEPPFSKEDQHIYNKYIRNIPPIILGLILVGYAVTRLM